MSANLHMALGLLVWPLLVTSVASLSIGARNEDGRSALEGPPTRASWKKPTHSPREQVFLHNPAKAPAKMTNPVVLKQRSGHLRSAKSSLREQLPLQPTKGLVKRVQPSVPPGLSWPSVPSGLRASASATAAPMPRSKEHTTKDGLHHLLPREQKPYHPSTVVRLITLHASNELKAKLTTRKSLVFSLCVVVLLGLIWTFYSASLEHDLEDDFESPRHPKSAEVLLPPLDQHVMISFTKEATAAPVFPAPSTPERDPQTRETLLRLEGSPGSWVKTYEKAHKDDKKALELLFRCNIIPMEEFADRYVNQDQIDEYVWIATQMLGAKSLEEWVEAWQEALTTFEDSASACAAARKHALSNLCGSGSSSPRIPRVVLSSPRSPRPPRASRVI